METQNYQLFQIPEIEASQKLNKKKIIAGLIDTSSSMQPYWSAMVKFWN
jgi:hypothetical protein